MSLNHLSIKEYRISPCQVSYQMSGMSTPPSPNVIVSDKDRIHMILLKSLEMIDPIHICIIDIRGSYTRV